MGWRILPQIRKAIYFTTGLRNSENATLRYQQVR